MRRFLLSFITITTFGFGASAQDSTAFIAINNITAFDGLQRFAEIPTPSGSNLRLSGDWTIEAWVRMDISSTEVNIIETYSSSATGGFAIRLVGRKLTAYQITNAGNNTFNTTTGSTTLNIGTWYHIAATLNESTQRLKIYLDGVLENDINSPLTTFNNNSQLRIGSLGDIALVKGTTAIDEVRIWNFAKTQAEVQAGRTSCLIGNETNLLAWYDFEGLTSTTLIDKSTNGNDGSIINYNSQYVVDGAYSCITTEINEYKETSISIYPNPTTSELTLNTTEQIENISIIDITGKVVKTITENTKTIAVSELVKGIYFLQIQTETGIEISKFIKE